VILYLAGPYSGDIDANIQAARKIAIELWEAGYTVFCPHLNTAHFEIDCKCTYLEYLNGDMEILRRCDALVLMPTWESSKGAQTEKMLAEIHGISIYYYPDYPKLELDND